jgi:hypothetical protein
MAFGNEGGEDPDGGAVGGGGYSGGAQASSDSGEDAVGSMSAPSIGGASPAGEMSTSNEGAALAGAAGGMEFGGFDAPMGGWGVNVTGPSVNTQGQVSGSHHAGTAADSFAEAIDALDAAIGAMPNISTNAPPSTGLPGMGYSSGGLASPIGMGREQFDAYSVTPVENYGRLSMPTQVEDLAYAQDFHENFDPMGSSHQGQYGQGSGVTAYGGPGQTMGTGFGGVMSGLSPTGIGNPMGYGMDTSSVMGPGGVGTGAPGGPAQNAGAGQMGSMGALQGTAAQEGTLDAQAAQAQAARDEAEYGDDTGAATNAGVGLGGRTGPGIGGGWGSDITGPGYADPNTTAFDMGPGAAQAEDAMAFDRDQSIIDRDEDKDVSAMMKAMAKQAEDEKDFIETLDEDEDYSGMPRGATVDQTVAALIQAIQDPKEAKNRGWLAHNLARSILGLPASTPESRARDALSNLEAQGQQEAMEMDVSTGEDERTRLAKVKAISNFRKQYKWAKDMSAKEIQAYIDNPALLNLKVGNEQMRAMDPKNMTANDVRQLWAPAMSA